MNNKNSIIYPQLDHYQNLPRETALINPLLDIPKYLREENELTEFYKLSNEYHCPAFGAKYLLGFNLYPFQMAAYAAILRHKFPLILFARGSGKTMLLAAYALYHAVMFPGSKIVLISASFRQAKLIFAEIQKLYDLAPLLRALSQSKPRIGTCECSFKVMDSIIKALPLGTGDKIRGERGHVILADEINSVPIEIFDVVVRGFAATESDPWHKTRNEMLRRFEQQTKDLPRDKSLAESMIAEGNKIVLSGTAGYKNDTFYKLFKQYITIISNKISKDSENYNELLEIAGIQDDVKVNCEDYCVFKMSYKDLPIGMHDIKVINNAKQTMPLQLFNMEYMSDFADDSLGFFKFKDVEAATSKPGSGFGVLLEGVKKRHYVMGVDPAKVHDRFAIVVIEIGNPNKVVYCWTMEGSEGTLSQGAKKIRELLRLFNIKAIAIDMGGGGIAVEEMVNLPSFVELGEKSLYHFDDESHESKDGLKILYPFNFNSSWIEEANVFLQKNIEEKSLMFPRTQADDSVPDEMFSLYDDVAYEILEMKRELISIEVTYTKTGKKQFNLAPPDPKNIDSAVRHKDRYSALLLANYVVSRFEKINYDETASIRQKIYESVQYLGRLDTILGSPNL